MAKIKDKTQPFRRGVPKGFAFTPIADLSRPPPPAITCDMLRQIKMPALRAYGEASRPLYRIAAEGAASCIHRRGGSRDSGWPTLSDRPTGRDLPRDLLQFSQTRVRNRCPD